MRNTRQTLPVLLRHPILWKQKLLPALINHSWRFSSRVASIYRRNVVKSTRVVAVVGSLGKTTTTLAVSAALGYDLPLSYQRGFGNAYTSVARRILGIRPSTPRVVVEVGIRQPGQMGPIAQMLRPDITVVTAIASDHNLRLRTLDVTRAEKSKMVQVLPASGTAVLNGDDPNVRWMAGQTQARVVTFGFDPGNDIRAEDIDLNWPDGMRFKLHANGESRDVSIRLVGRHMVYPILAAVAVALAEGLTLDRVIPALASLPPASGRLQPVRLDDGTIILRDEVKADLESLEGALDFLSEVPVARRGVVLADMPKPPGDSESLYQHLGQRIAQIADYAILQGDTPAVHGYLRGASRGGLLPGQIVHVWGSVLETTKAVREHLEPGDVVLVKARADVRLERVALALDGRTVRCSIPKCSWALLCEHCPKLERGWEGR